MARRCHLPMKAQEITILGAGVAGLSLARALAMRGWQVTVLEQAAALEDIGAGIQIAPNGTRVIDALGLGDLLRGASLKGEAVELRDGYSGDTVLRLDMTGAAPGYHMIHRADLIDLLAQGAAASGADIRLGQRVESLVAARMPRLTIGGASVDVPLLIGADGVHSHLRTALNGQEQPFFTRHVAWRAVIPADGRSPNVAEVHMGRGRHLVSYPLRGGILRNIVAIEERRAWAEESWTLRDRSRDLHDAFADFSPRVTGWLSQVEEPWLWGLFCHPVAQRWHGESSAILGDAAHPTLPFMAQGANMALEDAWVLAACLSQARTFAEAAGAFQAARMDRCRRIVAAADQNARIYHLGTPLRQFAHIAMRLGGRIAPTAPLRRFDWIYGHDVTA